MAGGQFFRDLQRRGVPRSVALYGAAAWLAVQVAGSALVGLEVPESAIRYIWIGAILGLPLFLLFTWRYDLTGRGLRRTLPPGAAEDAGGSLQAFDFALLAALTALAVGIGYGVVERIRAMERPQAEPARIAAPNSIAVLPLANFTGDPGQDYFVAGMHEAVISTLAGISSLRVISRTSTETYRGVAKPLPQIGRELGVANLVEGSVTRAGEVVRITVQLIRAATDEHLWAATYDRRIEDVLRLQAEVARAIASQVQAVLTPAETQRLSSVRQVNPAVYEAYLKGTFLLNQQSAEGEEKGLRLLSEAVALDPNDPLAYAGLALGYARQGHGPNFAREAFPRARAAAEQALKLDPLLAEAHAALGEVKLYFDWDWEAAGRSFERAIALNPSLATARSDFSWYFHLMGQPEKSLEQARLAEELDPLTPYYALSHGWLLWGFERPAEALLEANKALELDPQFLNALFLRASLRADAGDYDDALADARQLAALHTDMGQWAYGLVYARMGREADALRAARDLERRAPEGKNLLMIAFIHAALGRDDDAFLWLRKACDDRVDWLPFAVSRSGYEMGPLVLKSLRDDPRYVKVADCVGVP
jgi:TolB-like protein/Tfp pilus assembly protein PilF